MREIESGESCESTKEARSKKQEAKTHPLTLLLLLPLLLHTVSRSAAATPLHHTVQQPRASCQTLLKTASDDAGASLNDDDDDEEAIPGKMRVGEIKAELDLRGVTYAGVFERPELEALLLKARVEGKARPEILDTFNQQRWEFLGGRVLGGEREENGRDDDVRERKRRGRRGVVVILFSYILLISHI